MSSGADAIERCLREVERALARVSRLRAKQITKADDRDYLKSVAYAWFKSHRQVLAAGVQDAALQAVDATLAGVLDATSRASARTTYLSRLKDARSALAALRAASLVPPVKSPSIADPPPAFAALAADPPMKTILERRWEEV